eukprot:GHVL01030713.1.p1 GENE.GHVL01030713.1~~GHVL01030713.1.p1  ORF type:complete len:140 (+),score=14.04 GHVL01030713.1:132-551(+)
MNKIINEKLEKCKKKYITQLDNPSPKIQFEYAIVLAATNNSKKLKLSAELFQELIEIGYQRGDALYQMCLVLLKLGDYSTSRKIAKSLIELEPNNPGALCLYSLIMDRTSEDGLLFGFIFGISFIAIAVLAGLHKYSHN